MTHLWLKLKNLQKMGKQTPMRNTHTHPWINGVLIFNDASIQHKIRSDQHE